MSCKSGIYAVNTTAGTAISNGGTFVPNMIIRRYGQYCQLAGNGITIGSSCGNGGAGYYDVEAVATVTATAVGTVTATLYKDNAPVLGATATATAAAIGDIVALPITALVRLGCNCDSSNLTVVISGQATSSYNLAITVEKE